MTDLSDSMGSAEILVDGKPFDPFAAPVCEHPIFHVETAVVPINSDDGKLLARQLHARVVCGACGQEGSFLVGPDGKIGALSPDRRTLSVVLDF